MWRNLQFALWSLDRGRAFAQEQLWRAGPPSLKGSFRPSLKGSYGPAGEHDMAPPPTRDTRDKSIKTGLFSRPTRDRTRDKP